MKTASPHMLSLLNGAAYAALFDGAPTSVSASLLGPITRTYTWFFYGRFRQEIGGPANQVLWSNSAGAADLNTLRLVGNTALLIQTPRFVYVFAWQT